VFLKSGYAQAKVADVVRQAGVARGTFYAHFESKRNVFLLLAREWLSRLLPPAGPAAQPIESREDLETVLRLLHRGVLSAFEADRGAARLLFGASGGDATRNPALARALAAHDREWRRRTARPIASAKEQGLLRDDLDVELAAECVLGIVQRAARRIVLDEETLDVDRTAAGLARFSVAALA
jgi:AcrR family transcriptional regulator